VYESGLALMSLGVEQLSHDETALPLLLRIPRPMIELAPDPV
jgi:hypothetical protein